MKETKFIAQNEDKWSRFENNFAKNEHNPEELSDSYADITNDLSFAQTFYKRRTVRAYLNQLAQDVFWSVHKRKRSANYSEFMRFWFKNLPLELYRCRNNMLIAFLSFLAFVAVGAFSAHLNPDFCSAFLGDAYVRETIRNIENGNPMGIYDSSDQLSMFIDITTNNLKVALLLFISGYLFTIGTHALLMINGIMVGVFQYFFYQHGLFETSFLTIWIHGTIEISCIVIAAGAGITIGKGWMFPGSYTRSQAFRLATKRGIKIVLSLVPFLILAGLLESYVTHHYDVLPDWSKWLIIIVSFLLMISMFVLLPLVIGTKHRDDIHTETLISSAEIPHVQLYQIRTAMEMVKDAFGLYQKNFALVIKLLMSIFFPIGICLILFQAYLHPELMQDANLSWHNYLFMMLCPSNGESLSLFPFLLWTLLTSFIISACCNMVMTESHTAIRKLIPKSIRKTPLCWLGNLLFFLGWSMPVIGKIILSFLLPLVLIQGIIMCMDQGGLRRKIGLCLRYPFQHYIPTFGALIIASLLITILAQPFASVLSISFTSLAEPLLPDLLDNLADFSQQMMQSSMANTAIVAIVIRQLIYLILLGITLPYLIFILILSYGSIVEKLELKSFRRELKFFGKRNNHREDFLMHEKNP